MQVGPGILTGRREGRPNDSVDFSQPACRPRRIVTAQLRRQTQSKKSARLSSAARFVHACGDRPVDNL